MTGVIGEGKMVYGLDFGGCGHGTKTVSKGDVRAGRPPGVGGVGVAGAQVSAANNQT